MVLVRNLRAQSEIRNHERDQRVSVQSEPGVGVRSGISYEVKVKQNPKDMLEMQYYLPLLKHCLFSCNILILDGFSLTL